MCFLTLFRLGLGHVFTDGLKNWGVESEREGGRKRERMAKRRRGERQKKKDEERERVQTKMNGARKR